MAAGPPAPASAHHSQPPWSLDAFEVGRALGKGKFGMVYLAREKATSALVALKTMSKKALAAAHCVAALKHEVEVQSRLAHPHVLRLHAYFHDATRVYLVLEFAEGGSVLGLMRTQPGRRLTEAVAAELVAGVADALHTLHAAGCIHRDLKPENLLLDGAGRVMVSDFGCSAALTAERPWRTTFCGTPEYIAPEVLAGRPYGPATDAFSLGVLAYELLCGVTPFAVRESGSHKLDVEATYRRIAAGVGEEGTGVVGARGAGGRGGAEGPVFGDTAVSKGARDLILGLLRTDPGACSGEKGGRQRGAGGS
jgi:serine/threonine protein kinase